MKISLQRLENIIIDLKNDNDWVNDSKSKAEYDGLCQGLDRLINHIKKTGE